MGNLFFETAFYKIGHKVYEVAGLLESVDRVSNVCKKCGNEKISGTRMKIIGAVKGGLFSFPGGNEGFLEKINNLLSARDWCEKCCRFQFLL